MSIKNNINEIKRLKVTILNEDKYWNLRYIQNTFKNFIITDLCTITGANIYDQNNNLNVSKEGRIGHIYTTTKYLGDVACISINNALCWEYHNNRTGTILPILELSPRLFNEIIEDITTNENGEEVVYLGEYPQEVIAPETLQMELNMKFYGGELDTTGKKYTFNEYPIRSKKKNFNPKEHIEYIYKGKKYIQVEINSSFEDEDIFELTNKQKYQNGDCVWVEVLPVEWIIDHKHNMLISKKGLLSGIRYHHRKYNGIFADTDLNNYLNDYMSEELFQSLSLDNIKELPTPNQETTEVDKLIEEIKKYLPYYHGKEDINAIIDKYLIEYNNNLEELKLSKRNKSINLELPSSEVLYNNLIIKLEIILDKLKGHYEGTKKYLDMINILNTLRHLLEDGKSQEIDNELVKDFKLIIEIILPFIDESERNEIKVDLLNVINNYSKEILAYLDSLLIFSTNTHPLELKYHNLEEFELKLRQDINDILIKLGYYVNQKDLIKEVIDGISNSINGIYKESHNKILRIYLNNINSVIESINNKVSNNKEYYKYYIDEMNKILNIKLDYTISNEELFEKLLNLYSILYRLELSLDEEINIEKHKVKIIKKEEI